MTKREKTLVGLSVCGWAVVGLTAVGWFIARKINKMAGELSIENILKSLPDDMGDENFA